MKEKIKKNEKMWLVLTIVLYVLYNLPGVPAYGDSKGAIIHGLLTVLPLWVVIYVGMHRVFKLLKLKEK